MIEYLFLTEMTLSRLLWRSLLSKPTCIIGTWSYFSGTEGGFLRRIADRLRASGHVTDLMEDHPDWVTYKDEISLVVGEDIFATAEASLSTIFDFANSKNRFGRYDLAYKHTVCNTSMNKFIRAYIVRDIVQHDSDAIISGLDDETIMIVHDLGLSSGSHFIKGSVLSRLMINIIGVIFSCLITMFWVARRIRLHSAPAKEVFLGSDFNGDYRDVQFWQDLKQDGHETIAIFRNGDAQAVGQKVLKEGESCNWDSGRFSLSQGCLSILEAAADMFFLIRAGAFLPPDVMRPLIILPFRRMKYRALFNIYRFKYFWDRADYNNDHIIRAQELRVHGGMTLGLNHGIVSIASIAHQTRYIDYDIYFSLGVYGYNRYLRHTWPETMIIYPIGTFALTRDEYKLYCEKIPSHDIACFIEPAVQGKATLYAAIELATAFPERKVYVNTKEKFLKGDYKIAIDESCKKYPNLILHRGRSYDLMLHCAYVFTDGSTLTAEAMQLGRYGFTLELIGERWKENIYRAFPQTLITNAQDAVQAVRLIEAGNFSYPREQYGELIRLDGRTHLDVIRMAIGLEAKEEPHRALAYCPAPQTVTTNA
jgi:hypothetical protein